MQVMKDERYNYLVTKKEKQIVKLVFAYCAITTPIIWLILWQLILFFLHNKDLNLYHFVNYPDLYISLFWITCTYNVIVHEIIYWIYIVICGGSDFITRVPFLIIKKGYAFMNNFVLNLIFHFH